MSMETKGAASFKTCHRGHLKGPEDALGCSNTPVGRYPICKMREAAEEGRRVR